MSYICKVIYNFIYSVDESIEPLNTSLENNRMLTYLDANEIKNLPINNFWSMFHKLFFQKNIHSLSLDQKKTIINRIYIELNKLRLYEAIFIFLYVLEHVTFFASIILSILNYSNHLNVILFPTSTLGIVTLVPYFDLNKCYLDYICLLHDDVIPITLPEDSRSLTLLNENEIKNLPIKKFWHKWNEIYIQNKIYNLIDIQKVSISNRIQIELNKERIFQTILFGIFIVGYTCFIVCLILYFLDISTIMILPTPLLGLESLSNSLNLSRMYVNYIHLLLNII